MISYINQDLIISERLKKALDKLKIKNVNTGKLVQGYIFDTDDMSAVVEAIVDEPTVEEDLVPPVPKEEAQRQKDQVQENYLSRVAEAMTYLQDHTIEDSIRAYCDDLRGVEFYQNGIRLTADEMNEYEQELLDYARTPAVKKTLGHIRSLMSEMDIKTIAGSFERMITSVLAKYKSGGLPEPVQGIVFSTRADELENTFMILLPKQSYPVHEGLEDESPDFDKVDPVVEPMPKALNLKGVLGVLYKDSFQDIDGEFDGELPYMRYIRTWYINTYYRALSMAFDSDAVRIALRSIQVAYPLYVYGYIEYEGIQSVAVVLPE